MVVFQLNITCIKRKFFRSKLQWEVSNESNYPAFKTHFRTLWTLNVDIWGPRTTL